MSTFILLIPSKIRGTRRIVELLANYSSSWHFIALFFVETMHVYTRFLWTIGYTGNIFNFLLNFFILLKFYLSINPNFNYFARKNSDTDFRSKNKCIKPDISFVRRTYIRKTNRKQTCIHRKTISFIEKEWLKSHRLGDFIVLLVHS